MTDRDGEKTKEKGGSPSSDRKIKKDFESTEEETSQPRMSRKRTVSPKATSASTPSVEAERPSDNKAEVNVLAGYGDLLSVPSVVNLPKTPVHIETPKKSDTKAESTDKPLTTSEKLRKKRPSMGEMVSGEPTSEKTTKSRTVSGNSPLPTANLYPKVVIEVLTVPENVVTVPSSDRKSRSGSREQPSDNAKYDEVVKELEKPSEKRHRSHRSVSVVSGHEDITEVDSDSKSSTSLPKSVPNPPSGGKKSKSPQSSDSPAPQLAPGLSAGRLRQIKKENYVAARRSAQLRNNEDTTDVINLSDEEEEAEPPSKKIKVANVTMSAVVYRDKIPKLLGHTEAVLKPLDRNNPFVVPYDNSLDILIEMDPSK
jgi:hypothetical protein